jgi:DNA-directed RNA polymerase specialized sigma24 family protein
VSGLTKCNHSTMGKLGTWSLTQDAFDRLLNVLDPDRDEAGRKYERIREKLTNLFRWRSCTEPEVYVDETIDRVARKIGEGAEVQARDPYLYFHGVALNVLREHWKKVERHGVKSLDELSVSDSPATDPLAEKELHEDRQEQELRLECLDDCVGSLPRPQLEIVTEYHRECDGTKIAQRNELAKRLGIPLNALRIRAFRIRGELEQCVGRCVQKGRG